MKDYQIEEMMRMYEEAKENLESNCPLLEDEVIVAMVDELEYWKRKAQERLNGL